MPTFHPSIRAAVVTFTLGVVSVALPVRAIKESQSESHILIGAGDIGDCRPGSGDEGTAAIINGFPDATVFAAGDLAYEYGSTENFTDCYAPTSTWGAFRNRTRPSPGNHDWAPGTRRNLNPYFEYFNYDGTERAGPNGKGYYSYDLASWHVVSLDSSARWADSNPVPEEGGADVSPNSEQVTWLRDDLAKANAAAATNCTVAIWHHPLFSTGETGRDFPSHWMAGIWEILREYKADIVISGHEHGYQRFHAQRADRTRDDLTGIVQFVVGTGGYKDPHYWAANSPDYANLAVRENVSGTTALHGVLKLKLNRWSYEWDFIPVTGQAFTDSGTRSCVRGPSITSPSLGGVLTGATSTFQWETGADINEFSLHVGTTQGGVEIYEGSVGTSSSIAIPGLPVDGSTVYVRFRWRIGTEWRHKDYSYASAKPAEVVSPTPSGTLSHSTVTFTWNAGTSVTDYHLYVGDQPGDYKFYDKPHTDLSATVHGIPTDGSTIYVRLWSRIGGVFFTKDFQFTAATLASTPGLITSPTPGSNLPGGNVTFNWSAGVGVTEFYLYLGSTLGGFDIYEQSQNMAQTYTGPVPADQRPIYVRLWSRINGAYQTRDFQFTAFDGRARITSPAPNSTLPGSTVTFQWDVGVGVTEYYVYVGTTVGGWELHDRSEGTATSVTVNGIPTNGAPIYVRLYSRIAGAFHYRDYVFTAHSGGFPP